MSGMSNRLPRAMLMSTPRPRLAAGPLADDRADDGERDADPHPAEDRRAARPGSRRAAMICQPVARKLRAISSRPRVHGPDADHRRDGDREEHDQRAR